MKKRFIVFSLGMILFLSLIILNNCGPKRYGSIDDIISELRGLSKRIKYQNKIVDQANFEEQIEVDLLPDISKFPIVTGSQDYNPNKVQVEIFASTEKSNPRKEADRWMVDVANDFNANTFTTSSGKVCEIQVRSIASGTGYEFIKAKKYIPDAFTPSNGLWVKMAEAGGVKMDLISSSLVPNYAGLLISKETEKLLKETYNDVSFKSVVDAVIKKKISAAYTNPKVSSTGLNMLYTILYELAEGNVNEIFSDKIINSFEVFQTKVPLIATTTLHLRDLYEQGGKLDAFPTEYQTYLKMTDKNKFIFIPFGALHSNPLYAVNEKMNNEKLETLRKFAEFAKSPKYKKLAEDYGFVKLNYNGIPEPSGQIIIEAQKVWKEHKDSGKTVYAYFLTDTSGSMSVSDDLSGKTRISQLKLALIQASKAIKSNNWVGLMEFNNDVINRLDIAPFDAIQRGKFNAAVNELRAGGNTAMYNGITMSLIQLLELKKKDPNGKYYLFVLTDGETNKGLNYDRMHSLMLGTQIRIYPIAYGTVGQEELKKLAAIGETGLITGTTENIVQELTALFDLSL